MSDKFSFAPVSERIARMREKRNAFTQGEICTINTERTKLYTDYYKARPSEHPLLKRSGAVLHWAKNHKANIFDDCILVGTHGPDERSLMVYVDGDPEWIHSVIDERTFKEAWQSENSIQITDEQREILADAYEVWKDISISKVMEGVVTDDFYPIFGTGPCMNAFPGADGKVRIGAGIQGHYVANFRKAVNTGFGEVRRQAMEKINEQSGMIYGDRAKKHVFYHSVVRVCDAASILARNYAESCRKKAADTTNSERKAELLKMADSLDWISENPARTYWEGLQAIILYQLLLVADCQQHGTSMGRVDSYVGHLLEKELAEGTITMEQAQEYTDAFILRLCDVMILGGMMGDNNRIIELNERGSNAFLDIYSNRAVTGGIVLTIGGQKANGEDDCNDVTRLLIHTYARMKVPDPTVALRLHPNTPEDIWRLGIECSKIVGGMPQLLNDGIVIPSLMDWGFTREDAADYSIVGCVEPGGTGNEWSASGNDGRNSVWNMMEVIALLINGGVSPRTGKQAMPLPKLYEYKSFDEIKEAYTKLMDYCMSWTVSYASMYELAYSQNFPCVVASAMMEGCMESGKDVTEGGAKYNRTGLTACGTANVGDSLMAIKKLCFDDKTVSLRTLYDALQADWVGYEELRQTIINDVPHYGNDNNEVDELAVWGLEQFADSIGSKYGPRGRYCGGTFTVTVHVMFGKMLGASPDGRKAGDPIADAISPRQGFDKNGPTAYLRSAAKLPHSKLANGDQLNIRFSPATVLGDEGAFKLRNLIETYFQLGGMQVQFNVVGTDELYKAQKEPDNYQDMIVRIAGFSTYFVTLSTEIQNDFITRTEQSM